jgi:hypothetical protein
MFNSLNSNKTINKDRIYNKTIKINLFKIILISLI